MFRNFIVFVLETVKVIVIALIIVIPIRYFLFQPFIVSGQSMEPNYSHGDYLIVDEISYRFRAPERGEVVVFYYPEDVSTRHIKRIVGLPGEKIAVDSNKVEIILNGDDKTMLDESEYLPFVNNGNDRMEFTLGPKEYFVLGDNRSASFDSRRWGSLSKEYIIGRSVLKVFPLSSFKLIEVPEY